MRLSLVEHHPPNDAARSVHKASFGRIRQRFVADKYEFLACDLSIGYNNLAS